MKARILISSLFIIMMISSFATASAVPIPKWLPSCTVSASVKVLGVTVTISSTKATCAEAANDVREGIKALKNKH